MSVAQERASPELGIAPLNFIYSCAICSATFADAYEGHEETVQDLSDGVNPRNRIVTRTFLATCCHVFCAKHLENGAPAFHPAGQRPRAPCPVCVKDKGDSEPRDLYSVRGFKKDQHDPLIPPAWFTAPPIRLDGNSKEMEALRFQYIALIRYCQNTYVTRSAAQQELAEAEKTMESLRQSATQANSEVLRLQHENEKLNARQGEFDAQLERMQDLENEVAHFRRLNVKPRDLETFVTNKNAIRHYMKLVPMLTDQNKKMQARLASLGFAMALEPIPNFTDTDPVSLDAGNPESMLQRTSSSHTVVRSAHTSGRMTATSSSPVSQRPMKRRRHNYPGLSGTQGDRPSSREEMPPPPKPLSRMHSVRKLFPTLRTKFSRATPPVENETARETGDEHIYETAHSRHLGNAQSLARNVSHDDAPYMSGALPVDEPVRNSGAQEPQLGSGIGMRDAQSGLTYRPSPATTMPHLVEGQQPHRLTTEPSYIRLMDGLSQDHDIELGLKDPRKGRVKPYNDNRRNGKVFDTGREQHGQEQWSGKHLFFNEDSPGLSSTKRQRSPSDSVLPQDASPASQNEQFQVPVTPASKHPPRPSLQLENVVSPFFKSRQYLPHLESGSTERQDSSGHFANFQSQRPRMNRSLGDWREPPSLNGLSFFDSPVNSRNEPIQYEPRRVSPTRHYDNRSVESMTYFSRPESRRGPTLENQGYMFSAAGGSYAQDNQRYSQVDAHYNPSQLSFSRSSQLPSPMPPILSMHSPAPRQQPQQQWDTLQRAGVRSSRRSLPKLLGHGLGGNMRNLHSSRRSVKR